MHCGIYLILFFLVYFLVFLLYFSFFPFHLAAESLTAAAFTAKWAASLGLTSLPPPPPPSTAAFFFCENAGTAGAPDTFAPFSGTEVDTGGAEVLEAGPDDWDFLAALLGKGSVGVGEDITGWSLEAGAPINVKKEELVGYTKTQYQIIVAYPAEILQPNL